MLNVKADYDLKNCPLCGSDKIAMTGTQETYIYKELFAHAEIECFSCGTRFLLNGKNINDIINLWNGVQKSIEK